MSSGCWQAFPVDSHWFRRRTRQEDADKQRSSIPGLIEYVIRFVPG